MSISADIQGESTLPEVMLFEITDFDLSNSNAETVPTLRICNIGTVRWRSETYTGIPCKGEGFELVGQSFPKPRLTVGNVSITGLADGILLSSLIGEYNNFNGATIRRYVTLEKYLDDMPEANPLETIADDTWKIEQKLEDNEEYIKWELSFLGLENVKIPRRKIYKNYCGATYRDNKCGYTGPPVAKIDNTYTNDINLDRCAHNQQACALRFPSYTTIRFNGVPGIRR
jgi:lambda family phage minor tail protein L